MSKKWQIVLALVLLICTSAGVYLDNTAGNWLLIIGVSGGIIFIICKGYELARRKSKEPGGGGPGLSFEGTVVEEPPPEDRYVVVRPNMLSLDGLLGIVDSASEDPDLRNTKPTVVAKVALFTAEHLGYDTRVLTEQAAEAIQRHRQEMERIKGEIATAEQSKNELIERANADYRATEAGYRSDITDLDNAAHRLEDLFFPQGLPTPAPPPPAPREVGRHVGKEVT